MYIKHSVNDMPVDRKIYMYRQIHTKMYKYQHVYVRSHTNRYTYLGIKLHTFSDFVDKHSIKV